MKKKKKNQTNEWTRMKETNKNKKKEKDKMWAEHPKKKNEQWNKFSRKIRTVE